MGRDRAQHVGRGPEPAGAALQGCHFHRQSQALWAVHAARGGGVAEQLRQRIDGLQPEQEGMDRPRRVRPCPPVPRRRHQGSMGEADR